MAALCSQRIKDRDWVLKRLDFISNLDPETVEEDAASSDEVSKDTLDLTFQNEFAERVRFYLDQDGHPDHDDVRDMVGEPRFTKEADDPILRARLLLQVMTGSDLVSRDPFFTLTVRPAIVLGMRLTLTPSSLSLSILVIARSGLKMYLPPTRHPSVISAFLGLLAIAYLSFSSSRSRHAFRNAR